MSKSIIVIGAGDALGGAIAKRFAREGFEAVIVRRNADQLEPLAEAIRAEGGRAHPFGVDARNEEQMVALFDAVEEKIAPIEACVFNIGANVNFPIAETTSRVFFKVWEMACFSGFLAGREAARRMAPRGRGTIIFTGATASIRGREGFAAFASAKHGLRALSQSMARELGPQGLHVTHTIIDGAIDTAWIAENFPARYALKDQDGILNPDHIADAYWMLHAQPRDAWTHELDLRPWMESF
ncbi:MAG: SDR family oxidoreductase [Phenylobacterium sp.]|uniref:SDR family oxidoreductase n=1 Tax=Phenylobacterium sp. TaxID=1871053 RepID=UPI001225FE66|nr:SDR family oxidoreductase [Phenylobacterium sp.]TAJ74275.1 MAG: SDR family oxidoreductase [Phenylobacterium sp.]